MTGKGSVWSKEADTEDRPDCDTHLLPVSTSVPRPVRNTSFDMSADFLEAFTTI